MGVTLHPTPLANDSVLPEERFHNSFQTGNHPTPVAQAFPFKRAICDLSQI